MIDGPSNEDVLNCLFDGMPDEERAVMCSVPGDPGTVERWSGIPWRLGGRCVLQDGLNNYVTVSSFTKNAGGGYRRRKDQFAGLYAIMVDDIGTKIDARALPRELRPTLLLESSPGNFQATFKLQEPIRDLSVAESLIKRMIEVLAPGGVDPGMAGVTRVMRLPEGINGKPKYIRDDKVWRCKVARWKPDVTMTFEQLRDAFGLVTRTRAFIEPSDGVTMERKRGFGLVLEGLDLLGIIKRKGRWIDVTCPWIKEHTDRGDTGSAVAYPEGANGWMGGYRCHHGHCQGRNWGDLESWVMEKVVQHGRDTRGPFIGA
jgi:hypothetical protein